MANKLTKEKIDLLIEQTLNEISLKDFSSMFGTRSVKTDDLDEPGLVSSVISAKDAFEILAPIDGSPAFTVNDINKLTKNPDLITTNIQAALISIIKKYQNLDLDKELLKKDLENLRPTVQNAYDYIKPFIDYFYKFENNIKETIEQQKKKNTKREKEALRKNLQSSYGINTRLITTGGEVADLFSNSILKPLIRKYYQEFSSEYEKDWDDPNYSTYRNSLKVEEQLFYLHPDSLKKAYSENKKIIGVKKSHLNFLENFHNKTKFPIRFSLNYRDLLTSTVDSIKFRGANKRQKQKFKKFHDAAKLALANLELKITKATSKVQTITEPSVKTQRANVGLSEPTYITATIRNLDLPGGIESNIKELSKISNKYYQASIGGTKAIEELKSLTAEETPKMLAEIAVLDMFNTMAKEFDSGAGAYIFEYLLAVINGGQVLGKAKTDAGQMGATDFTTPSAELGSAKYYSKAENIKQSAKGFRDEYKKNNNQRVEIRYVIAIKKQGAEQLSTTDDAKKRRGTSDPSRIMALEIYTPLIAYEVTDGKEVFTVDGQKADINEKDDVMISSVLPTSVGVLYMAQLRTKTFREMINDALNKTGGLSENIFKAFQDYFDYIKIAKESGHEYTQTGKVETANKATKALNTGKEKLLYLAKAIYQEKRIDKDQKYTARSKQAALNLEENKTKSLKELDKLVERVILNKMNKL